MQLSRSTFSCHCQLLTHEILWTFLSSQSSSIVLNEIHLSLFTASLWRLFPCFFRHLSILGSCYCKTQIGVSFLCICPLIDGKFCHNIVKVYCGTTRLWLIVPQPLWQCYDAIYHQWEDRRWKNWRQFVMLAETEKTKHSNNNFSRILCFNKGHCQVSSYLF